jgi:hypothetical protein
MATEQLTLKEIVFVAFDLHKANITQMNFFETLHKYIIYKDFSAEEFNKIEPSRALRFLVCMGRRVNLQKNEDEQDKLVQMAR